MVLFFEACTDVEILKIILYVRLILKIVFFGVPIILIILLTFDLVRNVLAGNDDTMKKNQKVAIKRIIYSIALFFVYPIVNLIFGLTGLVEIGGLNFVSCWNKAESKEMIVSLTKTATFDANGGTVTLNNKAECASSESCDINFPIVIKKGYTLIGWDSVSSSCTSKSLFSPSGKVTISDDITFHACWEQDNNNSNSNSNQTTGTDNYLDISNIINNHVMSSNIVANGNNYINKLATTMAQVANNSGLKQSNGKYSDLCLGLAEIYTDAIANNISSVYDKNKGLKNNSPKFSSSNVSFVSNDYATKNEFLNIVFQSLYSNGVPIIIQVNGNKNGTSRHYVVAIGFKKSVSSNKVIRDSDIIIFDVYDAKIESLASAKGQGLRFLIKGTDTNNTNYNYGYQTYKYQK